MRKLWLEFLVATSCLVLLAMPSSHAQPSQSPNYRLDETSVGTSDAIGTQSANFGITSATGDLGVGNSKSSNFQINAGSKTSPDPALSFSVDATGTDFGQFSPTSTVATSLTFQVKNYTTYGYVVQIFGDPPTHNNHTLTAMATTSPSQVGQEQFGINLVANTSPINIGANLDNGDFGTGTVETGYDTPNNYRYVDGDIIASAGQDSGVTDYTMTFIANVSPLTPGGKYNIAQTLIATGTY